MTGVNADWQRRSLQAVWHPCTQMQRAADVPPLPISHGEGPWLFDYEGGRYFDATSSWWVNLFGHSDPGVAAALKAQIDRLPHVMLAGCTHAPAVELSERLSALTGGVLGHAFYASDGASAVEIALKMSFHFWRNQGRAQKREFACLRHGYHGETLGALSVTDVAIFRDTYDPLLMRPHLVMSPDARSAGNGETAADVAARAAADLRRLLAARHGEIAAFIVEPLVQCAAGMAMHDPSYLRLVRDICDEFGVHLIADEIAVGCGRTGTFFACEQAGIWPDFICLSKGITAGYLPLSLVLSRDAVYRAFLDDDVARGFLHSHSYTGNALACTAALAVLDRFERHELLSTNRLRSAQLAEALSPLHHDHRLEHLRQQGTIVAFDVKPAFAVGRFAERFHLAGRANGLLIRPIGRTVYLMPPYVLDEELIAWLAARLMATIEAACVPVDKETDADRTPEPPVA